MKKTDVLKFYVNPLVLAVGMVGYFGLAGSDMQFTFLMPLAVVFAWALVAWVFAIAILVWALLDRRRGKLGLKHAALSFAIVLLQYGLIYLLMNDGLIVTV